jgi:hypothetical protein
MWLSLTRRDGKPLQVNMSNALIISERWKFPGKEDLSAVPTCVGATIDFGHDCYVETSEKPVDIWMLMASPNPARIG